jgi:hypothetical protein
MSGIYRVSKGGSIVDGRDEGGDRRLTSRAGIGEELKAEDFVYSSSRHLNAVLTLHNSGSIADLNHEQTFGLSGGIGFYSALPTACISLGSLSK